MSGLRQLKDNRLLLLFLLGGGILLIVMSITVFGNSGDIKALEQEHEKLTAELSATERTIAEAQADLDAKKAASIRASTGIDPAQVTKDTSEAKVYFGPAFNWANHTEYERARLDYMRSLGENNSFTNVYLPPDVVIDTADGKLAYIDFKKIRATMDDMLVIPVKANGDRIRYVAFVRYFMHQSDADLANKDALEASQAVIEFTVAGDAETGGRVVSEVTARAGFGSSEERD